MVANALLFSQILLVATAPIALAAAPPADGPLMLVPLSASAARIMLPLAIDHGARLVARGPIGRSFIVSGERAQLAAPLLGAGILLLAAPATGCIAAERVT